MRRGGWGVAMSASVISGYSIFGGWDIFWGLTSSVARDMADNFEVIWLPTYNWTKTYSREYQFH